ncbi:MAG: hypothetical protein CMO80_20375 [Verrucomicrobiales bacterium]|nr:hypothetical protein [Verrucomicrobiales bacterium]|tara:strand:+ start:5329 stop:5667 length:339 start_codon:yes stop_codon:yes gene_type:complete
MITLHQIRRVAGELPGSVEGTAYGTPAFRVARKIFLRVHDKEDAVVVFLDSVEQQEKLISEDPDTYYITPHYEGYAAVLVRRSIAMSDFREIVLTEWKRVARKKDLAEFESR